MQIWKHHLRQLGTVKVPTDFPRVSKQVAISIPLFSTKKGWVGPFDKDHNFDDEAFRSVVAGAACWTAISLLTNTDLGTKGVPIYFYVEDTVMDIVKSVFKDFGVPEEWIREVSFDDPDIEIEHPRYGKKFAIFGDAGIDARVVGIWDSDSLVFTPPGHSKLEWYDTISSLKDGKIITGFFSEHNGGDESYVNWIRNSVGLEKLTSSDKYDLVKGEREAYAKVGLPRPTTQNRYGTAVFFSERSNQICDFLWKNHKNCFPDEGIVSMFMNSHGGDFLESDKVLAPMLKSDEAFIENSKPCLAHPIGQEHIVPRYLSKLKAGIDGRNSVVVGPVNRSGNRIHVIPPAHYPTHKDFSHCAFSQKARKLAYMSRLKGVETLFYGNELSEVDCDEFITVSSKDDLDRQYGDVYQSYQSKHDWGEHLMVNRVFNARLEHELRKRFQDGDVIAYTFGIGQHHISQALKDLNGIHCESGIGYYGAYMRYKVFESPSLMAYTYGAYDKNYATQFNLIHSQKPEDQDARNALNMNTHVHCSQMQWQDTVIPNSFDLEDFDFRIKKDTYLFFMGRVVPGKGVEEAMRIADATGRKLLVAGQGATPQGFKENMGFDPWDCVELLGILGVEERREILSKAFALLCLSTYPEPFGGVFAEAMLSGTPPVATRMGAFMDYIDHKVNGILIYGNVLDYGVYAIENLVPALDPYQIRAKGLRFINEVVAGQYAAHWKVLSAMHANNSSPYWIIGEEIDGMDWTHQHADVDWKRLGLDEKTLMTPVDA